MEPKSQSVKPKEKCEKLNNDNGIDRLARQGNSLSKREISSKTNGHTKSKEKDSPLILPNNTGPGLPRKTNFNPIVETNLKADDLDFLSTEMGDEIARMVVDEILSSQNLKYGAITRKPADNFI